MTPPASRLSALGPVLACLGLMLGLMLGQIACKPRTPQPVASAQPRIAALAPAYTQMLRELRREHQLIARHAYDQWAPPSVPSAGDQAGIDYEALLRLRPTHVLIQRGAGGVPAQLATLASANGWHVTALPLLTLADVEAACAEVNTLLAGPEHPPIALPLVGPATGPIYTGRVLLLYQLAPPIALGPGSYHHDMLMRVGGTSALAIPPRTPAAGIGATAFMTLDSEDLIRLDPDAIILIRPRDATAAAPEAHSTTLADVAAALARLNLRAARPGEAEEGVHPPRIAIIDDPVALIPGPGLRQVGAQIEAILTSWAAPTKVPASPPKNQP